MTKLQKAKLIDIFERIKGQFDFFEHDNQDDYDALKESIVDICTESIDGLRKKRM